MCFCLYFESCCSSLRDACTTSRCHQDGPRTGAIQWANGWGSSSVAQLFAPSSPTPSYPLSRLELRMAALATRLLRSMASAWHSVSVTPYDYGNHEVRRECRDTPAIESGSCGGSPDAICRTYLENVALRSLPQRALHAVGQSPLSDRVARAQELAYGRLIEPTRGARPLTGGSQLHRTGERLTPVIARWRICQLSRAPVAGNRQAPLACGPI